jgi:hypothetical protein
MSDAEIEALLQAEGLESEGADALLEWARGRAAELIASTEGDAELGPLLREGGQVGADQRAPGRRRAKDESARGRGRGDKKRGRGRKHEADEDASATESAREDDAREPEAEPEWKATLHGDDPVDASPPARDEEVTTPRGESSYAGPLPPVPRHAAAAQEEGVDEIEEIDAEELEILDDEESSEEASSEDASGEAAPGEAAAGEDAPSEPEAPAVEAPTFGPPDGTDAVPAWRAALFAAETGSDREAAQLIQKEESGLKPMPVSHTEPVLGERLEAEEDEISQHKIDLSDLDGSSE